MSVGKCNECWEICTLDESIVTVDGQEKIDALEADANYTKYVLENLIEDIDCGYYISGKVKYDNEKEVVLVDYDQTGTWVLMTTYTNTDKDSKNKKDYEEIICHKFEQACNSNTTTSTSAHSN